MELQGNEEKLVNLTDKKHKQRGEQKENPEAESSYFTKNKRKMGTTKMKTLL